MMLIRKYYSAVPLKIILIFNFSISIPLYTLYLLLSWLCSSNNYMDALYSCMERQTAFSILMISHYITFIIPALLNIALNIIFAVRRLSYADINNYKLITVKQTIIHIVITILLDVLMVILLSLLWLFIGIEFLGGDWP